MKRKIVADIIINLLIVLSTAVAVLLYFTAAPDALGSAGTGCFRYFTTDSNVLAALFCLPLLREQFGRLKNPEKKLSRTAVLLKYIGTTAVTLTLVTVFFFLIPTSWMRGGFRAALRMLEDQVFLMHFSTPVLAILSLLLLEGGPVLKKSDALWAMLPTVVYSIVYLVQVVFTKKWTDWYGFTFGGKGFMIPVALIVMYLVTLGLAALLRKARRQ